LRGAKAFQYRRRHDTSHSDRSHGGGRPRLVRAARHRHASLPDGEVNLYYNQTITATGGQTPYSWMAPSGLPSGLNLDYPSGQLSGTVYTAGRSGDGPGPGQSRGDRAANIQFQFQQSARDLPVPAPDGEAGVLYSQTLTASGGSGGYSWSVDYGLPAWMTLSPAGALSGTPTFPIPTICRSA